MNQKNADRLFSRIKITRREHATRPWEAFVDGKSVLSFATLGSVEAWVRDQGEIELLRTDLAAHFAANGSNDLGISGVCWSCPDSWVQAAAWIAESDPTLDAGTIGRDLAAICRYMVASLGWSNARAW
jgi:hypothetical protein